MTSEFVKYSVKTDRMTSLLSLEHPFNNTGYYPESYELKLFHSFCDEQTGKITERVIATVFGSLYDIATIDDIENEKLAIALDGNGYFSKVGYVHTMYVDPDFRKRGIGTYLAKNIWDILEYSTHFGVQIGVISLEDKNFFEKEDLLADMPAHKEIKEFLDKKPVRILTKLGYEEIGQHLFAIKR